MKRGARWYGVVLLIHAASAATAHADPSASAPPFTKGSRYWSAGAAVSHRPSIAWMYLTQMSASYYLVDDLAVSAGGMVGYVDAQRASGGAIGGPELGLRWHFAKSPRWSTYADAGAGAITQRYPLNDRSLRFNFELLAGIGASYQLKPGTLALGGVRLHHLSNARIRGKAHNFGYDGPLVYLELMRAF